jgi:hypothetical protein
VSDRPFLPPLVAVLATIVAVSACADVGLSIGRPQSAVAIRPDLDPGSRCVLDADPANGGDPEPPAEVVAAGDPTDPTGVVTVSAVGLGEIVLPSARLLVSDLFAVNSYFLPDMAAVDLRGFTGSAPVCLHVAHFQNTDQRAAFLHVRVLDSPVARWEVGTAGFGVDGGTGGIASAEAVRAATGDITDVYLDTLDANSVPTWGWLNITTDASTGANVIGFSTGYGDGGFPVYAGFDQSGRVASVVIDLLVLPWRWLDRVGAVPAA